MVVEKIYAKTRANTPLTIVLPHGDVRFAESQPNRNEKFLYEINEVEDKGNILTVTPLTEGTTPEFIDITLERHGCRVRIVLDDFYILDDNNTVIGVLIGHGVKNLGFGDKLKAIETKKPRIDIIGRTYDSYLVTTIEAEERGE